MNEEQPRLKSPLKKGQKFLDRVVPMETAKDKKAKKVVAKVVFEKRPEKSSFMKQLHERLTLQQSTLSSLYQSNNSNLNMSRDTQTNMRTRYGLVAQSMSFQSNWHTLHEQGSLRSTSVTRLVKAPQTNSMASLHTN